MEVLLTAAGVEEQMEWRRRIIGFRVDEWRGELVADCGGWSQTARLNRPSLNLFFVCFVLGIFSASCR